PWQWVFRSEAGACHLMGPSWSTEGIAEFLGGARAECWGCDCYGAQLKAPGERFQLYLAHQWRDLERLIEQRPPLQWAGEMQELFREAVHLWKRVYDLTLDGCLRRVWELEGRLDRLLERRVEGSAARRLWERYLKHR